MAERVNRVALWLAAVIVVVVSCERMGLPTAVGTVAGTAVSLILNPWRERGPKQQ